jgi:glucosamine kinase
MSPQASLVPDAEPPLLLGVDGGGTRSRARLADAGGAVLAEAAGGPANIRFGLEESLAAVFQAGARCLDQAGLPPQDSQRIIACLALAGASEPAYRAAAERHPHPYRDVLVTTDAQAACIGAHGGRDGGIIIVGTGSIGWAELRGHHVRVGGWGLVVSDEGSGAWLGREALRRVLWALDGRIQWTGLLTVLFDRFQSDPHAIVRFSSEARSRDFAELAPVIIDQAAANDPVAVELMRSAGGHVDALARALIAHATRRLALMGGLARTIEPWLAEETRRHLVTPVGDALDGALRLAAAAAGLQAADARRWTLEKHR